MDDHYVYIICSICSRESWTKAHTNIHGTHCKRQRYQYLDPTQEFVRHTTIWSYCLQCQPIQPIRPYRVRNLWFNLHESYLEHTIISRTYLECIHTWNRRWQCCQSKTLFDSRQKALIARKFFWRPNRASDHPIARVKCARIAHFVCTAKANTQKPIVALIWLYAWTCAFIREYVRFTTFTTNHNVYHVTANPSILYCDCRVVFFSKYDPTWKRIKPPPSIAFS